MNDQDAWKRLLNLKRIKYTFQGLQGEQLRTAPQGFSKDHPTIGLLRHKQFVFRHPLTDKQVLTADLVAHMDRVYRSTQPFFDHMSEVLTTDTSGNPLLKASEGPPIESFHTTERKNNQR